MPSGLMVRRRLSRFMMLGMPRSEWIFPLCRLKYSFMGKAL